MEEVTILKGMKSVAELSHEHLTNLDASVSEIAGAIGSSRTQVLTSIGKVAPNLSTQIAAQTTLIGSLKVRKSPIISAACNPPYLRPALQWVLGPFPLLMLPLLPLPILLPRSLRKNVWNAAPARICVPTVLIS